MLMTCSIPVWAQGKKSAKNEQKDKEAILNAISKISDYYNRNQHDSALQFYSKDIKVSFPDEPDMDYNGFLAAYRAMKQRSGVTVHTRDSVEEVIVDGDLAIVRFSWLTRFKNNSTGAERSWRARDFTVWRKESDGQWRFYRGMWFRDQVADSEKPKQ